MELLTVKHNTFKHLQCLTVNNLMDYQDSYQMKNENKTTTTTNVGTILKLNIKIDTFSTKTC
jgi:hypothetical protein